MITKTLLYVWYHESQAAVTSRPANVELSRLRLLGFELWAGRPCFGFGGGFRIYGFGPKVRHRKSQRPFVILSFSSCRDSLSFCKACTAGVGLPKIWSFFHRCLRMKDPFGLRRLHETKLNIYDESTNLAQKPTRNVVFVRW